MKIQSIQNNQQKQSAPSFQMLQFRQPPMGDANLIASMIKSGKFAEGITETGDRYIVALTKEGSENESKLAALFKTLHSFIVTPISDKLGAENIERLSLKEEKFLQSASPQNVRSNSFPN